VSVVIDTTGLLYGISVGLVVTLSVYMLGAGFLIFRRVTGL